MKSTIISILLLYSFSAVADDCTEKKECWPEGSAMRTGMEYSEKLASFDERMRKDHKALIGLLMDLNINDYLIDSLRSQQDAWIKFRDEDCALAGTLTGAGGSWPSTWGLSCQVSMTSKRLGQVQLAAMCLNKIDKKNLDMDYPRYDCLNRLVVNPVTF